METSDGLSMHNSLILVSISVVCEGVTMRGIFSRTKVYSFILTTARKVFFNKINFHTKICFRGALFPFIVKSRINIKNFKNSLNKNMRYNKTFQYQKKLRTISFEDDNNAKKLL